MTRALVVANIRVRWVDMVGAFVAICLGVGLITMTTLLWGSSGAQIPARVAAAPLIALSPQASNENGTPADHQPWSTVESTRIAEQLSRIDGVAQVVPDRTFYAQPMRNGAPIPAGDEALSAGHGWFSAALAPYRLVAGSAPRDNADVVLDRRSGFQVGQQVDVLFVDGSRSMTVSGLVDGQPAKGNSTTVGHAVFVADDVATGLSPGVFAIGLTLEPDASIPVVRSVAETVLAERGTVAGGDDRAALEPRFAAHERFLGVQLASAMALLGGFVSVFVVASTSAMGVAERRRELGLLRTTGALPRQIHAMLLGEAALIGVLGGTAGAALGASTAPFMGRFLQRIGVAAADYDVDISAVALLTAVVVGVAVAVTGAWVAGRRAANTSPMDALRDPEFSGSAMSPMRRSSGILAGGVGLVCAVLSRTANADNRIYLAMATTMALVVGVTLLAPMVIGPLVRVVTWPARRSGRAGPLLLRAELIGNSGRTAALAAPIIATVAFATLISGFVETSRDAYPAEAADALVGQSVVWPKDKPGLTEHEVELASSDGVVRAGLATRLFVETSDRGVTVLDGVGWLDGPDRGPGNVVVSRVLADDFGWELGTTMDVGFADGVSQELTVVDVRDIDPSRAGFNLSRETVREHDPTALAEAVFVPRDAAPQVGSGAVVYDAYDFAVADYERDSWLLRQFSLVLIILAVGYTAIGVANTAAMSTQGRRDDFRVLRLAGGTPRQIVAVVAAEFAVVAGIGVGLGLLVSVPSVAGIAAGFSDTVGRSVAAEVDPITVVSSVAASFALAIGAGALTTWRAVRRRGWSAH